MPIRRADGCTPDHFCGRCSFCKDIADWEDNLWKETNKIYSPETKFWLNILVNVVVAQQRMERPFTRACVERMVSEELLRQGGAPPRRAGQEQ
jgi:hypothetical protein